MKRFMVTDIRWASEEELSLPFWKIWNEKNPLPRGFWQRVWEYPYVALRIPSSEEVLDVGGTYPFVLFRNYPKAISVDSRDLNILDHPLHRWQWPPERLVIADARCLPFGEGQFPYSMSVSTVEETPDPFSVIREMIRVTRYRVVVTMDVSDALGFPIARLHELEDFLGCRVPPVPITALRSNAPVLRKHGQWPIDKYRHIRVLAFTLNAVDAPRSVAIVIPRWESYPFLRLCLRGIQRHRTDSIREKVYILDDQSGDGSFEKIEREFSSEPWITLHRIERPYHESDADVGAVLDRGIDLVDEQFVVMLDADTIPLSAEWLSFPVWLLERYRCSSVGTDAGLSQNYYHDAWPMPLWQPEKGYPPSAALYDNEWFAVTNNFYRVMRTTDAKVVAKEIGFTRGNQGKEPWYRYLRAGHHFLMRRGGRPYRKLSSFSPFRKILNARFPYLPRGCDNGVAANHFMDINRMGPKFNIPITSFIGFTPSAGVFGQNIAGLLFHFALSTRALSRKRREVKKAGDAYTHWAHRICSSEGVDDSLVEEMIRESAIFKLGCYEGSVPIEWYRAQHDRIEVLRGIFQKETAW